MTRKGSPLAVGVASASLREHLASLMGSAAPKSWAAVEDGFLRAMETFDTAVAAGFATDGERQNGKGDYFNNLLALILENAVGVDLQKRSGVQGLIFAKHSLDVTYPSTGIPQVLVEAKMMGTPQHPGNKTTGGPEGRAVSKDILKRCKEAGFKAIDLKLAYGMQQSESGMPQQAGPSGDLMSWLKSAKPRSYLIVAARVVSEADLRRVVDTTSAMSDVMDGVGLVAYRPKDYVVQGLGAATYESARVPANLEIRRVMQRLTADLSAARDRVRVQGPEPYVVQLPSVALEVASE